MIEKTRSLEPMTDDDRAMGAARLAQIQADAEKTSAEAAKIRMDLEVREIRRIEALSVVAHESGMFGTSSPAQAGTLMFIAKAFGLDPMLANLQFDVIEGKPAMKAVAMQSRFQEAGGIVEWLSYTDDVVTAQLSHPKSPTPVVIIASWEDAIGPNGEKVVGFKNKSYTKARDGGVKKNWNDSRRSMLRSRAISEGVRTILPGVLHGMYTPEEVLDSVVQYAPMQATETKSAKDRLEALAMKGVSGE